MEDSGRGGTIIYVGWKSENREKEGKGAKCDTVAAK
jgi:hypothetical protein